MHCDDKNTIFVLKENLVESIKEKEILVSKINNETNSLKNSEIQKQITQLEISIEDLEDQLKEMN